MSLTTELIQEIRVITQHLTEASICQENRFPATRSCPGGILEIHPANAASFSYALRNVSYKEAYIAVRSAKAYNLAFIDGALLQFRYCVNPEDEVIRHSLSFWPSPRLLPVDVAPWAYEDDEPFGDAVDQLGVIPVPVRAEFAPEQFVEFDHPRCHVTLGQYPNCRIAASGPIRPGTFTEFVLRHFYRNELATLGQRFPFKSYPTSSCISVDEQRTLMHFAVPSCG